MSFEAMIEEYETMTEQEQANFLSHSFVDLSQRLYEHKDKTGLKVQINNLGFLQGYMRELYDDLEKEERTLSIKSQLDNLTGMFKGSGNISEEFIAGLEELLNYAQSCLEENQEDEEAALNNLNALMDLHLLRYETSEGVSRSA